MIQIEKLLPKPPEWRVPWTEAEQLLRHFKEEMANTQQNPRWHGEGNVLIHTKMVCEALAAMEEYRQAEEKIQKILYLAALFHDIGKISATVLEDGQWVSRGHAKIGAKMARCILWKDLGYSGRQELQEIREAICNLIYYHSLPPYAYENEEGELKLRRVAANGELIPDFTIRLLCILSEADARGRICEEQQEMLEKIALTAEMAKEIGIYEGPHKYPSVITEYAHLSGRNVSPDYELYDDTWGEVIMMSGLPGTGKDTWIRTHCKDLPMISLDEIRKEFRVRPTDPQTKVVQIAKERAKEYLRKKQPFAWNATNITDQVRQQQMDLFTAYGASVRIVYLETEWMEELRRNEERKEYVPEGAIVNMMKKMSLPERAEAHRVEWNCV